MCEYFKNQYIILIIRTYFHHKILTGEEKENVK